MTLAQVQILVVLIATVVLFLWGRWRHDVVALGCLMVCVLLGLVPAEAAFLGFGHPAVITVGAVLVLSHGLRSTGAVDAVAQRLLPDSAGPKGTLVALAALGALLSSFMNNVGAMALLMPIAIQSASKHGLPPGKMLMPLSFATILGGMTTLIGTPPNLIVSAFRASPEAAGFGMFDYTPVGVVVAVAGVIFATLLGWRLVPAREKAGAESFDTGKYLTEARVVAGGKADGRTLREVEEEVGDGVAQIVGMVRNDFRVAAPNPWRSLRADDILVIEAEPESLGGVIENLGLSLEEPEEDKDEAAEEEGESASDSDEEGTGDEEREEEHADEEKKPEAGPAEVELQEFVVMPSSSLIGRSAETAQLRSRYGLSLLAISRTGRRRIRRLRSTRFRAGDVLLLQASPGALAGFGSELGAAPLAKRAIRMPDRGRALLASAILALAIAGAAFGLLPAAIAFTVGVVAYMVARIVPLRSVYEAIEWPVVVLLAALIPVAGAMETTGSAELIARGLLDTLAQGNAIVALTLILVLAMTLSDFMNNAATAAVMCPIAISAATQLDASPDAFLMAVAVGASCAFLTPIGHQNNTLILGPGGFRFGDYWRLGLPMEVLVVVISVPMLLWVWPL